MQFYTLLYMFYDVHTHLLSEEFDADRRSVITACAGKSVSLFETGLNYESNKRVLSLAREFSNVFACLGMHPSYEFDERVLEQIRVNKSSLVAVGEVGLDYKSGLASQEEGFRKLISVAEELRKPLIVHSRAAHERVISFIKNASVPIVLHSFTSGKKILKEASELSHVFFSVPSTVVYSEQFQFLVNSVPTQRLLCETDSPYLWKFERNTPLNVIKSYAKIAELKGLSLAEAESIINSTVVRLFKVVN